MAFYTDVHFSKAIFTALRNRAVDILTAQEDNATTLPDEEIMNRATEMGRVEATFGQEFLAEAHQRQVNQIPISGVVFERPAELTIGRIVKDFHLIAVAATSVDLANEVQYLPL